MRPRVKAAVLVCSACHGQEGKAILPTYPNLGGQHYSYLLRQMRAFKGGDRYAQLMMGQVDNLPDETLKNIAAFYADKALQEGDPGTADLALGKRSIVTVCSIRACRHAARAIPPGAWATVPQASGGLRAERGLRGYAAEGLPGRRACHGRKLWSDDAWRGSESKR